jgi:mannose-6-phosphate isomerase
VLRGGLTPKHVDAEELLRILHREPRSPRALRPEPDATGALRYATPAEEFELSRVCVDPQRSFASGGDRGVEVLACTVGHVTVRSEGSELELSRGRSCLVPAAAGGYTLEGSGEVHCVRVPAPR